ncbi:Hypothetical protein, putative [Bodo saltans]|uniref:RanBP2-type domain-containing protein n=1 Tax=Bodo saltans TaxID=75058 RepID=A0A0S4J6Y1_BODSA|nr:Hypothetical protein, putative [Bodo saltans]|eukprot:CUG72479.1 Hypothetical protein, putative [Bodo saltans]
MDHWWECRRCKIPNDPRYESCVSCGCTGSVLSPSAASSSASAALLRRRGSPPTQIGSSMANRLTPPRHHNSGTTASTSTPQNSTPTMMKFSPGDLSSSSYMLRDLNVMQTSSPSRLPSSGMMMSATRHSSPPLLPPDTVTGTIADLLGQISTKAAILPIENKHRSPPGNGGGGGGAHKRRYDGDSQLVTVGFRHGNSYSHFEGDEDDDGEDSTLPSGLLVLRGGGNYRGDEEQQHHEGSSIRRSSAGRTQQFATTHYDMTQHLQQQQHHGCWIMRTTMIACWRSVLLQQHQLEELQLRSQLSEALLELQSAREGSARASSTKDREIAALNRDVQHWKDEVLLVQKQNHDLARELRREHERRAELIVQAERMRVQSDRRVPDIVAEEFRLRLDTALECRASALQSLTSALQLLSMSIGDGIGHKYLTHSLDAAALLHSKTVVSLQTRVRELEDELSLARNNAGTL